MAAGMVVFQRRIQLRTFGHGHMQDVTKVVGRVVEESSICEGTVTVFNLGSTAAMGTIEFEPGLAGDLPKLLDRLVPPSRSYGHESAWGDGNAHSHLQATLLGPSVTIPVSRGRMVLGTWQQVVHLECDIRPRDREIVVTVMGTGK